MRKSKAMNNRTNVGVPMYSGKNGTCQPAQRIWTEAIHALEGVLTVELSNRIWRSVRPLLAREVQDDILGQVWWRKDPMKP